MGGPHCRGSGGILAPTNAVHRSADPRTALRLGEGPFSGAARSANPVDMKVVSLPTVRSWGSRTHEGKPAPRLLQRLRRRWTTLPNPGGDVSMPPVDAVPRMALTRVPVHSRPWTSATGLWVKPGLLVFRAAGVWSARAGWYRAVIRHEAVLRRRRARLGLRATDGEPYSGHREAARQYRRSDNLLQNLGRFHSIVLSLWYSTPKLAKALRFRSATDPKDAFATGAPVLADSRKPGERTPFAGPGRRTMTM